MLQKTGGIIPQGFIDQWWEHLIQRLVLILVEQVNGDADVLTWRLLGNTKLVTFLFVRTLKVQPRRIVYIANYLLTFRYAEKKSR